MVNVKPQKAGKKISDLWRMDLKFLKGSLNTKYKFAQMVWSQANSNCGWGQFVWSQIIGRAFYVFKTKTGCGLVAVLIKYRVQRIIVWMWCGMKMPAPRAMRSKKSRQIGQFFLIAGVFMCLGGGY